MKKFGGNSSRSYNSNESNFHPKRIRFDGGMAPRVSSQVRSLSPRIRTPGNTGRGLGVGEI